MERYELIKVTDKRPHPCDWCNSGWGSIGGDGIKSCYDTCERFKRYHEGELFVPPGFDRIKVLKFRKFQHFLVASDLDDVAILELENDDDTNSSEAVAAN